MSSGAKWVVRLAALWSLWVWAVLVRNMLADSTHSTSFRVVHIVLAVISITFAIGLLVIAQRSGSPRGPERPGGPGPAHPPG